MTALAWILSLYSLNQDLITETPKTRDVCDHRLYTQDNPKIFPHLIGLC